MSEPQSSDPQLTAEVMRGARVEMRTVRSLTPDPANPRRMTDAARAGLGASIGRFGYVQLPVYNDETAQLVGGHQGVNELLDRGLEDSEVPVVVGSWSPAEQVAMNATLNNPAIAGEYTEALEPLLASIGITHSEAGDFGGLLLEALMPKPPPSDGDFSGALNSDHETTTMGDQMHISFTLPPAVHATLMRHLATFDTNRNTALCLWLQQAQQDAADAPDPRPAEDRAK